MMMMSLSATRGIPLLNHPPLTTVTNQPTMANPSKTTKTEPTNEAGLSAEDLILLNELLGTSSAPQTTPSGNTTTSTETLPKPSSVILQAQHPNVVSNPIFKKKESCRFV